MSAAASCPQPGILAPVPRHARYLTFIARRARRPRDGAGRERGRIVKESGVRID